MAPEGDRVDSGREAHRIGDEHLPTVTRRLQPGTEVDDRTEVVAAALDRLAQVQSHPHAQARAWPRRVPQSILGGDGSGDPGGGRLEGDGEAVARRGEHVAVVCIDDVAQDLVVHREACGHRRIITSPQRRRTLDVGEQERHDARRQGHFLDLTHSCPSSTGTVGRRALFGRGGELRQHGLT